MTLIISLAAQKTRDPRPRDGAWRQKQTAAAIADGKARRKLVESPLGRTGRRKRVIFSRNQA